jgi:hypothetical protein
MDVELLVAQIVQGITGLDYAANDTNTQDKYQELNILIKVPIRPSPPALPLEHEIEREIRNKITRIIPQKRPVILLHRITGKPGHTGWVTGIRQVKSAWECQVHLLVPLKG